MQILIAALVLGAVAAAIQWVLDLFRRRREREALLTLADMAALGDIVPDTIHPIVDPDRCIGSGACIQACPEKKVLEIINGQAVLLNPLACIGHSACVPACPVGAVRVVFGTATRGVELPKIDSNFQTSRQGLYVIGELGGMGLIRNALRQGSQAADHIVTTKRRGVAGDPDAIVIGAGPAGIGATLRLMEAGLKPVLLEREALGGTIVHYPRAKVTMTGALEFPLFGKVNRRKMPKEALIELWNEIHAKVNLPLFTGELVDSVTEDSDGMWLVRTANGTTRRTANVLLALGRRGTPRKLDVPGEDLPKVHYRLLEPTEFRGKHVLVVGGGNSAVENALSLAMYGDCASVSISYRRGAFARCRADNRRLIDENIAAGKVKALMPSEVERIGVSEVTLKSEGTTISIPNDAVIVQAGGTAPAELLARFGVEVISKFGEA